MLATLCFRVTCCEEEVLQILDKFGCVLIGVLQVFAFGMVLTQLLREHLLTELGDDRSAASQLDKL